MCPKTTCASISETNKPKLTTQQVQPSLTIVVVQPCEVDKLLAAHLAAQNDLQRRDENGHWITTMLVKTFIMKPSHSLDTTDVHTILHISCFLQLLVSKLPSDSLVFFVFQSVFSLLFFWRRLSSATIFNRT